MQKTIIVGIFGALLFTGTVWSQTVGNFNDLNYWGTGPNRSALVVDWNDGKTDEIMAWGFEWTGSTTVFDMLEAIAADDPRFFARVDSLTSFGPSVFGIGYQTGSTGFGISGAQDVAGGATSVSFTNGISDMNSSGSTDSPFSSTGAVPVNIEDHYSEGWNDNGFWELYVSGDNADFSGDPANPSFTYPTSWYSSLGAGAETLVNDGWYAFSFAAGFTSIDPGTMPVAAVPEPSTWLLAGLGGALLLARRKRRSEK